MDCTELGFREHWCHCCSGGEASTGSARLVIAHTAPPPTRYGWFGHHFGRCKVCRALLIHITWTAARKLAGSWSRWRLLAIRWPRNVCSLTHRAKLSECNVLWSSMLHIKKINKNLRRSGFQSQLLQLLCCPENSGPRSWAFFLLLLELLLGKQHTIRAKRSLKFQLKFYEFHLLIPAGSA